MTGTTSYTSESSGYNVQIVNDTIDFPPHTFLIITSPNAAKYSYGFGPSIGSSPFAPGQVFDNTDHVYNETSGPLPLTNAQYNALMQFIDNSIITPPWYNVADGQECTAWAAQALYEAGVISPVIPAGADPGIFQLLLYNPYTIGETQANLQQNANSISADLAAIVQYNVGILTGLFINDGGQKTVTNPDDSYFVISPILNNESTINFYDPSGNIAASLEYFLNQDGSSSCSVNDLGGNLWTSSDFQYSDGGALIKDIQNNTDGTSQIIAYNADNSVTTTSYSSANGTGTVTKVDQENADGTSKITTYDSTGNATITKYTGANGTGTATQVDTIEKNYLVYNYTGLPFNIFDTTGYNGPPSYVGLSVTASVVVDPSTGTIGPTGWDYIVPTSISISDGITSYSGTQHGADAYAFNSDGSASVILDVEGDFTVDPSSLQVIGWSLWAAYGNYLNGGIETAVSSVLTGSGNGDSGGFGQYTGSSYVDSGSNTSVGSWSSPKNAVNVALSPLAAQTQNLSSVLDDPALSVEGSLQNLTVGGLGIVVLTNAGESVLNVEVITGGNLELENGTLDTDPITIDAGGNLFGSGEVDGEDTDNGIITAEGGLLDLTGNVNGTGILAIDATSTLELDGTVAPNITMFGADAVLLFGTAASFGGTISGAGFEDTFGIAGDQITQAVFDGATNELLLSGEGGEAFALNLTGSYTQNDFIIEDDGDVAILCFAEGTRIATPNSEVEIDKLNIGDVVSTHGDGEDRIKFIGKRSYGAPFIGNNLDALPVRVGANAIDDGIPTRDLMVSPGHALFIDGVLVPASRLINGRTITQDTNVKRVDYFHIELENGHNILIAENCAAESFRNEAGFRNRFQNAAEFHARYPATKDTQQASCVPRIESGRHLYAIQQRLAARAGIVQPAVTDTTLRGYVEITGTDGKVSGWAQFVSAPEVPVPLDIWIGGTLAARVLSNGYRGDVRDAGLGSGGHGFEATIPAGLVGKIAARLSGSYDPALPLSDAAMKEISGANNVTVFSTVGAQPIREAAGKGAHTRLRAPSLDRLTA